MSVVSPPPIYADLFRTASQKASIDWVRWFNAVLSSVNNAASVEAQKTHESASASLVSAAALADAPAGVYRVSWYARVTQAATSSSSLAIQIGWTDGAAACSHTPAAVTGNTTATILQGECLVRADNATDITYSTTYASVGATAMAYDLVVSVESI